MKRLLFSPHWVDGEKRARRQVLWGEYYANIGDLKHDDVLLVDNASLFGLQVWPFYQCKTHLPRLSHLAYGYWYRAFRIAIKKTIDENFDTLIHIDTDAYILKKKVFDYINNLNSGWTAFWSEKYGFPETSIQVICRDQLENALEFFTDGFLAHYPYKEAEIILPFTHVEKSFIGDRYGETKLPQTPEMDYYCQADNDIKLIYEMGSGGK